ncbi:sulfonate transport system permease protein [Herbaspirillum rubrisubalbicans]|uniref:ABC transporter permease n=1 Tax=Herbaspirillum rubrisubalbicans TaxID=80842 RepID=UPI00209F10B6|nr:ABC transporter permease [Herbaspirillum rubrisubalbicans]MCP1572467.1 sulfonate transport system permease protein [Herbaspirillum rubrisubalbicans]
MGDSSLSAPLRQASGKVPGRSAARWLRPLLAAGQGWLLPLLLLLLWSVAAQRGWMAEQILPSPVLVWQTAHELAAQDLGWHLLISLGRLFAGLLPGVLLGLSLALLMGLNRRAGRVLGPLFALWAQVPNLALIPVLMVFLGIGNGLKVAVILNASLIPMLVHAQAGVRDVPLSLREAAATLRLSFWMRLTRLYLPAALPAILTGLRLSVSAAWTSLVVVELLASSEGIGYLMVWGRQMFQLDIVFVCIFVIGAMGLVMETALHGLDARLIRWPRPALTRQQAVASGRDPWTWLPLLALLALWWLLSRLGWLDLHTVPSPAAVLQALVHGWQDGSLLAAMGHSLGRYLQGLAWGVVTGAVVGLVCGLSYRRFFGAGRLLAPLLGVLRHIVIFAWLPLLTAWAGTGEAARILFIAIASFFPMFVASQRGVLNLSPQLLEVAQVLRLTGWKKLRWLVLPGAASNMFAGLRLALMLGWLATIGAEYFMASSIGIGSLMINAQQVMNVDVIFAGLILVSGTGAAINLLGQLLERRLQRWRQS